MGLDPRLYTKKAVKQNDVVNGTRCIKMADKVPSIYQQILNSLCDKHCVPRIPVHVYEKLDGMYGDFDSNKYYIRIEADAPMDKLYHEFVHYLIRIINVAADLEENICDYSATGIIKDIKRNNPVLKEMVKQL